MFCEGDMKTCHKMFIKVTIIFFIFSWIVLVTKPVSAQSSEDNLNTCISLIIGTKQLNIEDWDFVAGQKAFGVDIGFSIKKWPVNVVTGFIHSQDKIINLNVKNLALTNEYFLGIRKEWGSFLGLHLTGGVSVVNARVEGWDGNDSGTGVGPMFDAGINIPLFKNFKLGCLYRYSHAQANILGTSTKLGGEFYLFSIGYQW